jgi:hypothetical protein
VITSGTGGGKPRYIAADITLAARIIQLSIDYAQVAIVAINCDYQFL